MQIVNGKNLFLAAVVGSILVMFSATNANAETPEIKVTSFVLEPGTRLAELCGETDFKGALLPIKVLVDPNAKSPGSYLATTNLDGKFCVMVRTLTGRADVTLARSLSTSVVAAKLSHQ